MTAGQSGSVTAVRRPALVLVLAAVLALPAAAGASRVDHRQVIGTHNSYKLETSPAEQAEHDRLVGVPGDYAASLAYSHRAIGDQLGRQAVRALELDLFADPAGGRYAHPLARRMAGLGPLEDPAWREPGTKVMHIADTDYATSCVTLVRCLGEIETYLASRPGHPPIPVLLELKRSDPRIVAQGGVVAPRWDVPERLDALDREIRSVLEPSQLLTPDDVRRGAPTLEAAVLRRGWPEADGKVLLLLDNEPGEVRDAYRRGRRSLQGRVLFTNAEPGAPDAAFLKRNDPSGAGAAEIRGLVRKGYLVRTRSDLPLSTVRSGSTALLRAAVASGAHVVSTDFPEPGMSARHGTSFVGRLPGDTTARCNRVVRRCP